MSRIHDALKRAEQESETAPTMRPVAVRTEARSSPSHSAASVAPALARPLHLEQRLAGCPQRAWAPDTATMLFHGSEDHGSATEKFRTLRARLHQAREVRRLKTILVTSALPHEGRSFVAANLAQVMALQPGCKALLVDADLRNPRLHRSLGTIAAPGLSEYLLNQAEEFGVIHRGQMERLFFIPSGRALSGPAELIGNGRLKALLDRLEPLFDWIIIDSPASIPVSDAGMIAHCCDGVLMVVRSSATPFEVVRRACQKFRREQLVGVVLNGVPEPVSDTLYHSSTKQQNGSPAEIRV
jgi:protein-tyrosine kinase